MPAPLTRRAILAGVGSIALAPAATSAAALPQPTGPVLLEVAGTLRVANAGSAARFDRAMLDALPQDGFETNTPWIEQPTRFDGVPGAALVEAIGAFGREVVATALNDYRVTIPIEDFRPGGLLIATRIGGSTIPVRARGPLWIVYPFDANPAFRSELFYSRSIWQLRSLLFRA